MNFTEDWFSHNIGNFESCMDRIPQKKLFLEIGSFEGRSTCWLLKNGLGEKGSVVCVDPYSAEGFDKIEARFWSNIQEATEAEQKVSLMRTTSYKALSELVMHRMDNQFDFIYVDGSHAPDVALTDACMAWGLLKQGGVMLFDDYQYPHEPTKVGIDAFLSAFEGQYDLVFSNYQLAVQKK
jgi:predicted O-methyltransferase YrrM